jgi:tetratricopeptide (TPR) repeat protein
MMVPLCSLAQNPQTTASSNKPGTNSVTTAPRVTAHGLYTETLAALLLDHDQEKAQKGFLRVVQIDPHFGAAWFNLGVIAESEKSWVQAESYFDKYLAYAPNGPDARRAKDQLALLPQYASGEISPEAAKSAQYDALIQRARVFLAAGHFRESIAEAGRAQAVDNSRWESYAVVSLCMAKQNKAQEAAQFASIAIEQAPPEKRNQVQIALSPGGSSAEGVQTNHLTPEKPATVSPPLGTGEAITPAILHVIRKSSIAGAMHPYIFIDQQRTVEILNGQNVKILLPPGSHTISVGDKDVSESHVSDVVMESGKEYWIKLSFSVGISKAHSKLTLEDQRTAQTEAATLVVINFGDAFTN